MGEEWKHVKGFKGLYEISTLGKVKSLITGKILKQYDNGHGYMKINLYKNKKCYKKYIHRLVAEAFIRNRKKYKEVNHKDGKRSHNEKSNLEWCDRSQNVKHTYDFGGRKSNRETHIGNNYSGIKVTAVNIETDEKHEFKNMTAASKFFNKNKNAISAMSIKRGKIFEYHGYLVKVGD